MIFRRKKQNKRGFTLAETIIALAIIATVSVASVSLVLTAQNASMAALQKQQAQFYAADIVSCYRAGGDFKANLNFALGTELTADDSLQSVSLPDGMAAAINPGTNYIRVTIHKGSVEGKVLASLEFTKGGTP